MEVSFFEWGQLALMSAQVLVSGGGLIAILVGLARMKEAGVRRDREIDVLASGLQETTRTIGQALERQGQAMTQAFTQQGQALERQGEVMTQAFTQQGQALERQGEVMTQALAQQGEVMTQALAQQGEVMTQALAQQGQALERQGRALEELLRRTA